MSGSPKIESRALARALTGACALFTLVAYACAEPPGAEITPGTLIVRTTETEGTLFIDARRHGPLSDDLAVAASPGDHVVELRRGDQVVAMAVVSVVPGARVEVELDVDPRLVGGDVPAAGPTSATASPREPPSATPPAPSATGRVRIATMPPADVRVDGVLVGRTPLVVDLRVGQHTVEARAAGIPPITRQVDVVQGQDTTLTIRMGAPGGEPAPPPGDTQEEVAARIIPSAARERIAMVRGRAQRCYERLPTPRPTVRLDVQLAIEPDGAVSHVSVEGGESASLRDCVAQVMRSITYPATGERADVRVPLVFTDGR